MKLLFILHSNWLWTEMLFYHTLYLFNISFFLDVNKRLPSPNNNLIGSGHERQTGEIGDYELKCCIVGEDWKIAVTGRTQ